MNTSPTQSISWNRHFRGHVLVNRESQGQDQGNSFPTGFSQGSEKSFISYKIDSVHGAIRAEIIGSESGKVIREIVVKPDTSMIFKKGSFFDSVI